jgi:hypothetical protein
VLKELTDNALDACEEAEVAPVISIAVKRDSITIQDNAGGISTNVIKSILDYSVRVSSREAYVSPTRGAQGNALKTILAMGYVLGREAEVPGLTIIETRGVEHRIEFQVDHVNNEPKVTRTTKPSAIKVGTKITVMWPPKFKREDEGWGGWGIGERFRRMAESYVWFNPHLTLRGTWCGRKFIDTAATDPAWEKWRPRNPTSAHWYDEARLKRYLAAHVAHDRDCGRDRTVREFLAEFRGLSATAVQRKILAEVGCSHQSLAQFFGVDQVNRKGIACLLASMRKHSKPVAPKHLGVIGASHLKQRFLEGAATSTRSAMSCAGVSLARAFPTPSRSPSACTSPAWRREAPPHPASSSPAPTGASESATSFAISGQPGKGWRRRWRRCAPTRGSR